MGRAYEKKHGAILEYLKRQHEDILNDYKNLTEEEGTIEGDFPIWVFWYQGFENAPTIVLACLSSLKACAGKHPVIEISKDNINEYVEIPQHIIKKLENKSITITHFSDILRTLLLVKYGGCWADATLFFEKWIQEDLSELVWYSLKQEPLNKNSMYVSAYRWSSYFQICAKNAIIVRYMRDVFLAYWEKEDCMIDYFLIDYFFALGYQEIPAIKNAIDAVPKNNPDVAWMNAHINDIYNTETYTKITEATSLFKLSWRIKDKNQVDSYFNFILSKS